MLEKYRQKRSFAATPEPEGASQAPPKSLIFVVQKHAARRLHYDFRLEVNGVLKSWAVPKGPSTDPREKRLAVHVEDHPLDYATFEGVIPERRYGAGNVIVWDYGSYSPDDDGNLSFDDPEEASARVQQQIEAGKLSVTLRGSKLRGSWALVRTRARTGEQNQWLMIKHKDRHATEEDPEPDGVSVLSGRTLEELGRGIPAPAYQADAPGTPAEFPKSIRPMLPTLVEKPFDGKDWLFEPKLDGVRALARLNQGNLDLRARSDAVITAHYPEVVEALTGLPGQLVLDGEIVALNERGQPDFELLQQRLHLQGASALASGVGVVYYVFDLLYADGMDLTRLPLQHRKLQLNRHVAESERIRHVHYVYQDGEDFFQAALALGLEGIVAKRKDSRYEAGTRSKAWLKVKGVQEQEFVVCGYLPGRGHRSSSFGALVLGYYEDDRLRYAGTVGSGFDDKRLDLLTGRLSSLKTKTSPFSEAIPREVEKPVWVRPELVVRVRFSTWTRAGILRTPVYVGLRDDIGPTAVVRERPLARPPQESSDAEASSGAVDSLVAQLDNERDSVMLETNEDRLKLTNLNKALWPAVGKRAPITKRDFIRYLIVVSPWILPHLENRPMNLTRYPEGIGKPSFYQKNWTTQLPEFVETVDLFSEHNRADQRYVLANNVMTLAWLGQLATIELHPWLSRIDPSPDSPNLPTTLTGSYEAIESSVLNYPDFLIFDLDPYVYAGHEAPKQEPELNRTGYERGKAVAFALKGLLEELSLQPFLKTSGKTGLHVYVPVMRHYDYSLIRKACATIGKFLNSTHPGLITMDWTVERRTGKVFFDHNQNSRGKTLAAPYSLRPSAHATVATPIAWEELDSVYPTDFTIATVPARLAKRGDPWQDILAHKHDLRSLFEGQA